MKRALLTTSFILSIYCLFAQSHIGIFVGPSAYNGDLANGFFPKKTSNIAVGLTYSKEFSAQARLRAGLTYTVLGGADRYSTNQGRILRNLSFETSLIEFSLLGEYYLLDLYEKRISPYVFAGGAIYHYNPYALYGNNQKAFLQPLSTEGQGLTGYGTKPYSLTQPAIPFGGGVKFLLTENIELGIELGARKLFTDYLDDVSTNYADQADLLAAKGQLAVDISYRGDEITGGSASYPAKGYIRGGSDKKDWYYFGGIHLSFTLGGNSGYGGKKSRMGCPAIPM